MRSREEVSCCEIGVAENVAILDDGGNLKAFSRMDGAPLLSVEIAQNKAYTALFGVPTQDFFNFIQDDPSLLAGLPTLPRVAAYGGGFPIKVDGEIVGAIGVSGHAQCRTTSIARKQPWSSCLLSNDSTIVMKQPQDGSVVLPRSQYTAIQEEKPKEGDRS